MQELRFYFLSKGIPDSFSSLELEVSILFKTTFGKDLYHRSQYSTVYYDLVPYVSIKPFV